jgi:hypothetical protein
MLPVLGVSEDSRPKWGLLGDDASLVQSINDFDAAILGCVYRVEFTRIRRNFATVNLYVTVARAFKGDLKLSERIVINFPIDDVPVDPADREKKFQSLRDADIGGLRHCFIERPQSGESHYSTEWLFVPKFTEEMNVFLEDWRKRSERK